MLATRVDRSFLTGKLHHQGGIIYFLIALAVIFLLIWVARSSEERRGSSQGNARGNALEGNAPGLRPGRSPISANLRNRF
jgi:hypothetical protein